MVWYGMVWYARVVTLSGLYIYYGRVACSCLLTNINRVSFPVISCKWIKNMY